MFGLSIPPFYLGLMLMLIFCVNLGWLPISSDVWYIALLLPVCTVAARSLAIIARMTRSSMLEVLNQDYIANARAHGFKESKIVFGCALKNSMNAIITCMGIQFGSLLGGAVVTEKYSDGRASETISSLRLRQEIFRWYSPLFWLQPLPL